MFLVILLRSQLLDNWHRIVPTFEQWLYLSMVSLYSELYGSHQEDKHYAYGGKFLTCWKKAFTFLVFHNNSHARMEILLSFEILWLTTCHVQFFGNMFFRTNDIYLRRCLCQQMHQSPVFLFVFALYSTSMQDILSKNIPYFNKMNHIFPLEKMHRLVIQEVK